MYAIYLKKGNTTMCIWFKQSFISLTRVGWGCVRFFTVKINFQPLYIFLEVDITIMSVDINSARIFLITYCEFCWLPDPSWKISNIYRRKSTICILSIFISKYTSFTFCTSRSSNIFTQFWHFITIIVFVRRALFILTAE